MKPAAGGRRLMMYECLLLGCDAECSPDVPLIRLWDHIPLRHTGPPSWFVIHSWEGTFRGMVEALLEELTPEVPAMTAALMTRTDPNAGIMLWIGGLRIVIACPIIWLKCIVS